MEEEAYEVNTNGADVAIQVGIVMYKKETETPLQKSNNSTEYRERERELTENLRRKQIYQHQNNQ